MLNGSGKPVVVDSTMLDDYFESQISDSAECSFMVADVPAFVSHPPFYRQYLSHGGSFCDICVISDDFRCNNSLLYILHIGQCQMFVRHRFCPHNNWDGRYPPGRLSYHIPGRFREFQRNTRRGDFPHRSCSSMRTQRSRRRRLCSSSVCAF